MMLLLCFVCLTINICHKCSGSSGVCRRAVSLPTRNAERQSPVDIETCRLLDTELPALKFGNHWDPDLNLTVEQKFNAVVVRADDEDTDADLTLQGGPLMGVYLLDQVLFHWCTGPKNGSEHSVNGVKFSQEVHFVYYDSVYGCVQNAINKQDGIAIVAVFTESKVTNYNLVYDQFINSLHLVRTNSTTKLKKNVLRAFKYVMEAQEYYLYEGSMTSPPYCESVMWMVAKKPVKIHSSHLAPFRSVVSKQGPILCNTRDQQPLNGRSIYDVRSCFCCSCELTRAKSKPNHYV